MTEIKKLPAVTKDEKAHLKKMRRKSAALGVQMADLKKRVAAMQAAK